jgi:hypothetical protein
MAILNTAMKRSVRYKVLTGKQCGNCERPAKYIETKMHEGRQHFHCRPDLGGCDTYWPVVKEEDISRQSSTHRRRCACSAGRARSTPLMSPMDSIRYYKAFLQSGLLSMDPHTGFMKAWVGGIDFKHFQYDHVEQARRQVGSTFKPFVYATAIREGMEPCRELPNQRVCFDMPPGQPDWCPENSDAVYGGMVTLEYALANSMNTVTAWLMKQYGPQAVTVLARHMGVKSPLEAVPSLCLGVADLTLMEMTGAFSTFANQGVYIEPITFTRIEDKNGNTVYDVTPNTDEALDERTAYIMLNMLKGVTDGAYNPSTGRPWAPACACAWAGATREVRQHQVPDGGQDRYHAEQQRRLVHRDHPRSGDRCVDRCGRSQRALQPPPTRDRARTWPCRSMATT